MNNVLTEVLRVKRNPVHTASIALMLVAAIASMGLSQGRVLGKAGQWYISEDEFVRRFELTPGVGQERPGRMEEAKEVFLYSLIAEKLLAQEAGEKGWSKNPGFLSAFDHVRSMIVRDELYREEVSAKVHISNEEVIQGMTQAVRQRTMTYLFFQRKEDAEFIRGHLQNSSDLLAMVLDSSLQAVKDTATVIWGDANWTVEQAAYRLKRDQVSPVIAANGGFYILTLERESPSQYFLSLSQSSLLGKVRQVLRDRKERERLDEFTRSFVNGKTGYAKSEALKIIARAIRKGCDEAVAIHDTVTGPAVWRVILKEIGPHGDDTVAVAGPTTWNIADVMDEIENALILVKSRSALEYADELDQLIRVKVLQELLAQEGMRRKLDEKPAVHMKLEMWRSSMLAAEIKEVVRQSVKVDSSDVWAFLTGGKHQWMIPRVRLRELWTNSPDRMQSALEELGKGALFEALVDKWSEDIPSKAGKGLTNPFLVTERAPLGPLAADMGVGQRYGPVRVGGRFVYFELVERNVKRDTSTAGVYEDAVNEVRGMKVRRVLSEHIAALGKEMGFTIFQDQLKNVSVSGVPMMTFRLLGFGGRMFEVPFVIKEIDWLNVGTENGKVIP